MVEPGWQIGNRRQQIGLLSAAVVKRAAIAVLNTSRSAEARTLCEGLTGECEIFRLEALAGAPAGTVG